MKYSILTLYAALVLVSCSRLTTETLYKSERAIPISRIGIDSLFIHSTLDNVRTNISEVYLNTSQQTLAANEIQSIRTRGAFESFESADSAHIVASCTTDSIDALLTSKLTLLPRSMGSALSDRHFDCIVEMRLYSCTGILMYHTKSTTSWNSHWNSPTLQQLVGNASNGIFSRMAMHQKKRQ